MKILLVNPPNSGRSIPEEEYGIKNIKMIFRGEPLALEVIAGNLTGYEVCIADLKAEPDVLWQIFDRLQPDVVGITGVTCEAKTVLKIAEDIKKRSNPVIVVGGHHASCDPGFFNSEYVDYIVLGLGKLSFRELVDAVNSGKAPDGIPGVAKTDVSGKLSYMPRKYSTDDLVDNKAPRYDLVKKNRYKYVMSGVGGKAGYVATAFGCTHRCFFCSIPNMTGGKYLTHSVDAVLRDMKMLEDVPMIRLVDANTFGDDNMAEMLGHKILEAGLNKRIVADVRADTVVKYPEIFGLWKQAGLAAVVIGFEEISDERLKQYNKRSGVAANIAAIGILREIGIKIIGDFIVSPDYTHKEFEQLENFANEHAIDLPIPSVLTPIPGTPLYKKLKDRITIHDLDYYTFTNAVVPTKMNEKEFYETYSALLNSFLGHVNH